MTSSLRTTAVLPFLLLAAACGGTGASDTGLTSDGPSAGGTGGASAGSSAQAGKGGAAGQPGTGGNGGGKAGSGQGGAAAGSGQGGAAAGSAGASGASTGGGGGKGGTAGASGSSLGGAAGATGGNGGTMSAGGGGLGGAAGAGGSTGVGGASAGAGGGGTAGAAGCAAANQLVYVFTTGNDIWSFDPPSKKFTKVATPDCPGGMSANSMAIDRDLVAWLNYIDGFGGGGIYRYDLKTKKGCQASGINLPSGFEQVGMGFSTDAVGTTSETLYIDGISGGGLAKVDMGTKNVTKLGTFANDPKLSGQSAELTGTGDARLFGYFTTSPNVRVAELDKTNGNVLSDFELKGVAPPSDWAFTFWGGDFYLYVSNGGNSNVVHYDPIAKTVDAAYIPDTGMTIIGAGVSTCAPTTKP